jgi:hypothetical protein
MIINDQIVSEIPLAGHGVHFLVPINMIDRHAKTF